MLLEESIVALTSIVVVAITLLLLRLKILSASAALGAVPVSLLVLFVGGWKFFMVFATLISSGLALTRLRPSQERPFEYSQSSKTRLSQMLGQALAPVTFIVLAGILAPQAKELILAFVAALGEATADTWAAELGFLYGGQPRLVTNLVRKVEKGTSGGVTLIGDAGAALGSAFSLFISLAFGILCPAMWTLLLLFVIVLGAQHIDSLLGATIQGKFYCRACKKFTEKRIHSCGSRSMPVSGFRHISNEAVNLITTFFAGFLAYAVISFGFTATI